MSAIDTGIKVRRNDSEVGLMEAPEHIVHDAARRVHAVGFLDGGAQLVVDRLPVKAAGLGLPMFVAHRFPDIFERIDVEPALFGGERGGKHGRYEDRGAQLRQRAKPVHSFSRTLAPSAPPSMGSAVRRMNSISSVTTINPTNPAGSSSSLVMAVN